MDQIKLLLPGIEELRHPRVQIQMLETHNGPPPGAILEPKLVAPNVISSTVLGLVAWWIGHHTNLAVVKDLVVRNFKGDDVFAAWCKLRETCQQAAGQPLQPPPRHRADAKLAEELVKEVAECEKNGSIHLFVPSSELGMVRSRIDCNPESERPVATRLESLEDMVKGVVERLTRMEANQERDSRRPQPAAQPHTGPPQHQVQAPQQQNYAAVAAAGLSLVPRQVQQLLGTRQRRTSSSVKRSVSGVARDTDGNNLENADEVFTEVGNRKKKKRELFTGKATLESIPGVSVPLQAAYQHFVGNTPGNMEKETLELVFKELAVPILEERGIEGPLVIEQCNLLTKEQNTRTRVWRVVVPHKFKEIMQDDRVYPSGWHHREFEGHYRPPLSSQERAEKEAKKLARQQNDNRVEALLRQLAGNPLQQQ